MHREPQFEFSLSRQFSSWMIEQKVSIVLTTYQAGKLFLLGIDKEGKFSLFNRTFNRVMGLNVSSEQLFLSDLYQLWRFENTLDSGQQYQGCLLYTSPSPRDGLLSRMPSSA